jgi:hypothetical protein
MTRCAIGSGFVTISTHQPLIVHGPMSGVHFVTFCRPERPLRTRSRRRFDAARPPKPGRRPHRESTATTRGKTLRPSPRPRCSAHTTQLLAVARLDPDFCRGK